jgi:DNA polymerase-1
LPRDKEVRKNFVAEKNNVFLRADYSQIEIRVAAEVSRDKVMLKAYKDGVDLHALTASLIAKKKLNEVTKDDRQKAKAFNFGLLFGLGPAKFSHYAKKSYGAEVSQEEATAGVKTFRNTYSGYREWQLNQATFAEENHYVSTPCGKKRCLDSDHTYGPSANTPIQGGASECMLYSLIHLNDFLTSHKPNAMIVNCVHDEVVVESHPDDTETVAAAIKDSMQEGFLDVFPNGITRGITEVTMGKNWAEAK